MSYKAKFKVGDRVTWHVRGKAWEHGTVTGLPAKCWIFLGAGMRHRNRFKLRDRVIWEDRYAEGTAHGHIHGYPTDSDTEVYWVMRDVSGRVELFHAHVLSFEDPLVALSKVEQLHDS